MFLFCFYLISSLLLPICHYTFHSSFGQADDLHAVLFKSILLLFLVAPQTKATMAAVSLSSIPPDQTVIKLPHPYHTEYTIQKASAEPTTDNNVEHYRLNIKPNASSGKKPPVELHAAHAVFTEPIDLKSSELPPHSNNSAWARARRSPCATVSWDTLTERPTLAQAWLILYVLFTTRPSTETLRLELTGANAIVLGQQLKDVALAIDHPLRPQEQPGPSTTTDSIVVVALRSTFWQGAGSPFGPRPVWCPEESSSALPSSNPLHSYPLTPLQHTMTITSAGDPQDPDRRQQTWHPIRPAKPAPGAVIYSRWIPHLQETFSMVSLDWQDAEHLRLFHEWQNDPRVSQGWNETGTLEQHREYLRKMHVDPHQVAVLAKWDDAYFAYFEIYWAKVREINTITSSRLQSQRKILTQLYRRIGSEATTTPETLTVAATPLSAMSVSVARTEYRRGGAA